MSRWSVSDLIDLEFFILRDETQTQAQLEQRDREIYLRSIKPQIKGRPESSSFRRTALSVWLAQMRTRYQGDNALQAILPGDVFIEARRLLGLIITAIGVISGAGLALSMLVYRGQEPVNVSVYFGVLVVVQILTILFMLRFFFIKTSSASLKKYSVLYPLLGEFLLRIMDKLVRSAARQLSGAQAQGMEAVFGIARAKHTLYSRVIFWTIFALVQSFGIAFNLGVIGATLIRVFTADLAFGWQSTIQLSSQAVHTMVHVLAAPWSWIVPPGIAYPSLVQIEGSRMVLKDGIYHLVTADLVSWWPFLVCAVCVYGLLPRIILYAAATLGQRRSISRLDFSTAGFDRLMMRMTRPAVSSFGEALGDKTGREDEGAGAERINETLSMQGIPCVVLIPSDIISLADQDTLRQVVAETLGWEVTSISAIQGEPVLDQQVLASVSDVFGKDVQGVVVVLEAWQPPIVETIEFIKVLRQGLGKTARIAVLLTGKPEGQSIFTLVDRSDKEVWAHSLMKLADPYLRLEALEDTK